MVTVWERSRHRDIIISWGGQRDKRYVMKVERKLKREGPNVIKIRERKKRDEREREREKGERK